MLHIPLLTELVYKAPYIKRGIIQYSIAKTFTIPFLRTDLEKNAKDTEKIHSP